MATIKDLGPYLRQIIFLLKHKGCCAGNTSAGTNSNIPEGFSSIAIVKTNETGTVTVTMSDLTTYPLTIQGEGITDSAGSLPAYLISSGDGGTWKWHGIK